jgi:hypothetical protein
MPTCRFCGNATTQPDAVYCAYCGASLLVQQAGTSSGGSYSMPQQPGYYGPGAKLSPELTEMRYERALRRAEQMGTAALILSILLLILLI